jgi:hypothetical protein
MLFISMQLANQFLAAPIANGVMSEEATAAEFANVREIRVM